VVGVLMQLRKVGSNDCFYLCNVSVAAAIGFSVIQKSTWA
jgi:hypothetical protein